MANKQIPPPTPKRGADGIKLITVPIAIGAIIAVIFIAYLPTFRNGYVFWDDPEYILHNPLMTAPLSTVLFGASSYYLANYHPLTILVYTLEHHFFGSDMMGYHAVSLLLHISNSLVVFFFIYYLLSEKNVMIPLVTALLFGVHPMHVESVAWASELKDVLYTFFFLASLICYVWYVQKGKQLKYLGYALGLFLFSLISKGQAVTLPLCFLLVDYFLKRKFTVTMLMDKIPFIALSLIFGVIAMNAQNSAIIHDKSQIFQTFFWGFYGLCLYLIKFILPINLSGLYPYPINPDRSIPLIAHVAPVIILVILFLVFRMFRNNRFVLFGILFFLVNIVTVLKFIPVGDAIIADRYSYIPYIGLFFVVGYGFNKLLNNPAYKSNKKVIQFGGIALLTMLSSLTWARTMVWKDSFSFWGDTIEKNGNYWRAYYCIGQEYYNKGDYVSACNYFTGGIKNDKYCPPTVYMWRGITELEKLNNTDSAIADFKTVLNFGNKSDPSQIEGRVNLGLAYCKKGMYNDALQIYNELITMAPDDAAAYLSRGILYVDKLGEYDKGIADFNRTIQLDPGNVDAVINRGIAFYKKGNFDEALNNYNTVMSQINDNGRIYFLAALAYAGKKEYAKALQYGVQAQKKGFAMDNGLLQEWKSSR